MPGLDAITIFLFQNALDLAIANWIGEPSMPALAGNRSQSSRKTNRTDLPLTDAAEFAPPRLRKPPRKEILRNVWPGSRDLGSATNPRSFGLSLIIGRNRSVTN